MPNYDEIDKALNIESSIVEVEDTKPEIIPSLNEKQDDIKKDYEYTRANLYSLIEKGQEAINGIMELAGESDSPRAYEVAGQLIKNVGDVTDKLIDLQHKMKKLKEEDTRGPSTVNNSVFIGSTADLQKLLKQGLMDSK